MALCVLLGWLSFVADGAHALFSDSTTLTSNTLTTGSADILVSNSQSSSSSTYDTTRPGFSLSLVPGVTVEKFFLIKNASASDVDMDIDAYVTHKAMDGLFMMVATEEKRIRENPVARTTDLLKQVFGAAAK